MHTVPPQKGTPAPRPYPDPSRYRLRAGDGFALGIVPFIDVLLIVVTLLIVLAAGGAGELRALPLAVPSAHGDAPKAPAAKAATYLVRADGLYVLPPEAAPTARPDPVALPEPEAILDDGAVAMFCIEARLDPSVAVRVAAEPDSRHAQLVGFLSLAQRCGIRDVEVLVREDRLALPPAAAAGLANK